MRQIDEIIIHLREIAARKLFEVFSRSNVVCLRGIYLRRERAEVFLASIYENHSTPYIPILSVGYPKILGGGTVG